MNYKKLRDDYLTFRQSEWTPGSLNIFKNQLNAFLKWRSEELCKPIAVMTWKDVKSYMEFLKDEKGMLGQSITAHIRLLGRWMQWLEDDGKIINNPVKWSHLPRYPKSRYVKKFFTADQYEKMLSYLDAQHSNYKPFWKPAIIIAWNTGMRFSDVALLQWSQVDFEKEVITKILKKTRRFRREVQIPIEAELYRCLLTLHNTRDPNSNSPNVIPDLAGWYVKGRADLVHEFKDICIGAGFPQHSFHCFRHGFVTKLINCGVDSFTISDLAGISLSVLQHYTHVSVDTKRAALEKARAALHAVNLQRSGRTPNFRPVTYVAGEAKDVGGLPSSTSQNLSITPAGSSIEVPAGLSIPPVAGGNPTEMTNPASGKEVCLGCRMATAINNGLCSDCAQAFDNENRGGV
jgi:integrase